MDMLPIKPVSNNLIKPTTGTANDGGSKSQSGYINTRTSEKTDELTLSDESKRLIGEDPVEEEKSFLTALKEFFLNLLKNIGKFFKIFSFKFPEKKQVSQNTEKSQSGEVKNFLGYTRHDKE